MIDSSTIALVKQRKNQAFKAMYQQSIGYVYTIVKRYVSNESEHADVIQEIYARIFLSVQTFDETRGDFKFWLRRLVINQCLQHYRQGKSPRLYVTIDHANEMESEEELPMTTMTKAEIESYLKKMPEGYRKIFMLVIIDDYTHKEVGQLLNISPETSRSQLSRAKAWLRRNILNNKQKFLASGF